MGVCPPVGLYLCETIVPVLLKNPKYATRVGIGVPVEFVIFE